MLSLGYVLNIGSSQVVEATIQGIGRLSGRAIELYISNELKCGIHTELNEGLLLI